ncbi:MULTISPECIES: CDP-archaeol synthase [unclassified Mesorhizobium]|uniref:CDP-archaeol synthase n=1 Tax=unclassified Mesorhizobium TaxID=325217 RepID=UPI000FDBF3D3|nr:MULTISPECIES: CDP-archaeol synthase [unclassified Mesorhizobium]TGQ35592.1 CDP-archaeol synthase [Mesorhizobium sp. M00.F.Ca.ET.216.01.1.1]TIS55842.1 MAG: CDP-archaeol synthase [Mesorhizobium sp.]TIS89759.1 MAG: CDP-archaeol synthase [Mesorhizobium sp.]TJW07560.1 MAG: CDP-archaeol synthase [Mesorhizobium sp.]
MTELHFWPIFQCLILLTLANGVPVIGKKVFGEWLAWPIDGGWGLWDGQPFLGRSKTLRGVVLAIMAAAIGGPLVGLDIKIGALIGLNAMIGDILSSFLKRRLRLAPSAEAPGFDQVPESLLPLLVVKNLVGLSGWDILIGVGAFWIGELVVSRLLYMLRIRDRPY